MTPFHIFFAEKSRHSMDLNHSYSIIRSSHHKSSCNDKLCTNLLSTSSYKFYEECKKLMTQMKNQTDISYYKCAFRDGRGRDPVALVSCPGSGNTWVRGLLEKATGICTGAIYCDPDLRAKGFKGESIHDGSVLVIKTHVPVPQWKDAKITRRILKNPLFGSAILLIRNPFDALVAEENRLRSKGHVTLINISRFGE